MGSAVTACCLGATCAVSTHSICAVTEHWQQVAACCWFWKGVMSGIEDTPLLAQPSRQIMSVTQKPAYNRNVL